MYIIVETYTEQKHNPYYSVTNSYRESEYYPAQAERVVYCHSDEALATWVRDNIKAKYTVYRAEKVNVALSTVVNISVS